MATLIQNFLAGTIDVDLASTATTLSSPGLANVVAIAAPDIMVLVLDPKGTAGAAEIVHITAHTAGATTATIARAQEGTTARTHLAGSSWINSLTRDQFNSMGDDPEFIRDTIGTALRAGANVTITVDDVNDTITIASTDTNTTDPEVVRDTIGTALRAGANVTIATDDVADTITISSTDTTDPEVVRDTIATALRAGANVSIVHDDVADTITITSTDTNTTDPEVVRDTMAAALVAGAGITLTVDDVADTITIASTGTSSGNAADTEIMAIMGAF